MWLLMNKNLERRKKFDKRDNGLMMSNASFLVTNVNKTTGTVQCQELSPERNCFFSFSPSLVGLYHRLQRKQKSRTILLMRKHSQWLFLRRIKYTSIELSMFLDSWLQTLPKQSQIPKYQILYLKWTVSFHQMRLIYGTYICNKHEQSA